MIKAKIAIVASTHDTASMGIAQALLSLGKFKEVHADVPYDVYRDGENLLVIDTVPLADDTPLDWETYFDVDLFVIVYRHSGRAGKRRLTLHAMGNFGPDPLAGHPRSLGFAHPLYQRHMYACMRSIVEEAASDYLVNFEVTHHGPTHLNTPVFFLESGDGEEQWVDTEAHTLLARALERFLADDVESAKNCIGFGGDHYGERFERRTITENWAFGHIVCEREFKHMDTTMLDQVLSKTVPRVDLVVWDKKKQGTAEDRERILNYFAEKGIEVIKI